MHGHAERIFHVTPGTLDVVRPQFTSEERDERVARSRCGWHSQESPHQVVNGFRGCLGAAGHYSLREIEPGCLTRCRNELAGRLLPTNVARDAGVELLVPLERCAIECAHVRGIIDGGGCADVVAVAQALTDQIAVSIC